MLNSSEVRPNNPKMEFYNSPNTRIVDEYNILNNNCAVMVSNALNKAGSNILKEYLRLPSKAFGQWRNILVPKVYRSPLGLQNHMKG